MKCKYCEAELAQWGGFCPVCGKKNTEEEETELIPEAALLEEEELVLDEAAPEETELPEEEGAEPSPKLKRAKRIAAMSGCVALLAVLATVLFFGIRGGWDVGSLFDWMKPRENNVQYKDSYILEDKKAVKKMDAVVATMGDQELTNAQLQIYYWSEVYSFLNNYYYYLSYIGFDYTASLSEQTCYFDSTLTWEQYFLESAIQVWQSNVAFAELAKANNFTMPEEYRTNLDGLAADLQESADEGGYESVDAMVQESFGAGVTLADYQEYMEVYYLGYSYFAELYEAIDPTMEEIEAYFLANEEALAEDGITKDGTYTVDVRHILVMIDNIAAEMEKDEDAADAQAEDSETEEDSGTTEDGETTEEEDEFTAEQWEACLAAAQKIYDEYLAGEQTAERFGELANLYSDDNNGEVTNGGLYTYVAEGDMVEDFNSWCFEEGRQPGNTGIVKTQFGYHVMYFVGSEETWITGTRSAYISDQSNKIVEDALKNTSVEVNYKKIVLANVEL